MTNQIHLNVIRATFTAEGQSDTEVRVLPEEGGGVSFSINFGEGKQTVHSGLIGVGQELQLAEALQFVADAVGAKVPGRLSPFVRGWIGTAADVHHTAKSKGFWEEGEDRNNGEMLALIHSELSEALEGIRQGNPPDDKLPEFSSAETELADAVIRIMDMAHARGWRVAQAIEAKMGYNTTRPYKHGKEF